jgi:hypothetical protein
VLGASAVEPKSAQRRAASTAGSQSSITHTAHPLTHAVHTPARAVSRLNIDEPQMTHIDSINQSIHQSINE